MIKLPCLELALYKLGKSSLLLGLLVLLRLSMLFPCLELYTVHHIMPFSIFVRFFINTQTMF